MNIDEIALTNQIIKKFILNPEKFILFRGESIASKDGTHFTTDENWAKRFGNIIIKGTLPIGSKIKSLTKDDFKEAFNLGFTSEHQVWDLFFSRGYDAILGTDSRDSSKLDVIVNPKHLERFKPQ